MVSPVSAGGGFTRTGIATIVDMDSLEVEVDVNESYIARVAIGQRAEIRLDAYADRPYGGFVRQIVPTADRQKATVVVKVHFDELDRYVLPEMGAKVTFHAAEPAAGEGGAEGAAVGTPPMRVFVPQEALGQREGRPVVVVVENGRVRVVPVETGDTSEGEVEVRSGLRGGERVVLAPAADLANGSRVRLKKGS
jgi:RND family efflux transporter MFP subunit